jgi:hypothetical protein
MIHDQLLSGLSRMARANHIRARQVARRHKVDLPVAGGSTLQWQGSFILCSACRKRVWRRNAWGSHDAVRSNHPDAVNWREKALIGLGRIAGIDYPGTGRDPGRG